MIAENLSQSQFKSPSSEYQLSEDESTLQKNGKTVGKVQPLHLHEKLGNLAARAKGSSSVSDPLQQTHDILHSNELTGGI